MAVTMYGSGTSSKARLTKSSVLKLTREPEAVYRNSKFLNLPKQYRCLICKQALRGPFQLTCGHRLCSSCFAETVAVRSVSICPVGQEDVCKKTTVNSVNRDMGAERDMDKMEVYCPYQEYGCSEIMPRKHLEEHGKTCRYSNKRQPSLWAVDQCDFNTLSSMLDSDMEEGADLAEPAAPSGEREESSDDDIDEDELEKLASLVEMNGEPEPLEHLPAAAAAAGDARQPTHCSNVNTTTPPAPSEKPETTKISPEISEELRMMQDRIKMLETMLMKQNPDLAIPSSSSKQAEVSPAASSKESNPVPKSSPPTHKLRTLEEDLFGKNTPSDEEDDKPLLGAGKPCKGKRKKAPVSSAGSKTSFYGKKKEAVRGNDSDSDWDDIDGEKTSTLSDAGQELNTLMKKRDASRVAHTPKYDTSELDKIKPKQTWQHDSKSSASSRPSSSQGVGPSSSYATKSSSASTKQQTEPVMKENFSGIRIINPTVSSMEMKRRMEGKKMIQMSRLHLRLKTADTENDWVTMGVVVNKSEPRVSSKGSKYSLWKLSDLEDCERVTTLFLFGNVFTEHWKTSCGTVVGILNANQLRNSEKYQTKGDELSITVDHPKQLMLVGKSKDLGTCKARTKSGKNCSNFINQQKGEFCIYHVQSAYKKTSSKRADLQSGYSGVMPKSFEKKLFKKKDESIIYGGQYLSSSCSPSLSKPKNQVTLKSVQGYNNIKHSGKNASVSTLGLQNLLPEEDQEKIQKHQKMKDEKNQTFHDLLTNPTPGSMQFVRHLAKKEKVTPVISKDTVPIKAITVTQFMKEMAAEVKKRKEGKRQEERKPSKPKPLSPPLKGPCDNLPRLGRGFAEGQQIALDFDIPRRKPSSAARTDAAMQKALATVKAKGGIDKEDPNAVKPTKKSSPKSKARIQKRLADAMSAEWSSDEEEGEGHKEPPKKRSRLLGDIDLNSPEIQKLLKMKSAHDHVLTQEDEEKLAQYFDVLEKKEQMEEKMSSCMEITYNKVYSCRKCRYTALSLADRCKQEQHDYYTHSAKRRFFRCLNCKRRTVSFQKIMKDPCLSCGSCSFERTSMVAERKGPRLIQDEFKSQLRGEERKWVNS